MFENNRHIHTYIQRAGADKSMGQNIRRNVSAVTYLYCILSPVKCVYIYTWKKVREHLLCYEGKLWTIIFLQSKYVLTKLFS